MRKSHLQGRQPTIPDKRESSTSNQDTTMAFRESKLDSTPTIRNPFKSASKVIAAIVLVVLLALPALDRMAVSSIQAGSIIFTSDVQTTMTDPNPEEPFPRVAWLMTFPNSGTTYTLKLIQQYTNTTTATNYGNEQGVHGTTIPVRPELDQGPFLRYANWQKPSKYIITKTHCGGTCLSCTSPSDYVETVRSFEIHCREGNRIVNDTKTSVLYPGTLPQRAIHVIRNPFDNFVARMHLQQRRWVGRDDHAKHIERYTNSKEGFALWCLDHDRAALKNEMSSHYIDDEIWEIARGVPCHAEFIRYAWWHNFVIEVARKRKLPMHTLFYEDYESNWNKTVDQLFHFLELEPAPGAQPPEFLTGKHYADYFAPRHRELAAQLVAALASPEAWALLKRYFDPTEE